MWSHSWIIGEQGRQENEFKKSEKSFIQSCRSHGKTIMGFFKLYIRPLTHKCKFFEVQINWIK